MNREPDFVLRLQLELTRARQKIRLLEASGVEAEAIAVTPELEDENQLLLQVSVLTDLLERLMKASSKSSSMKFSEWTPLRENINKILDGNAPTGRRFQKKCQLKLARKIYTDMQSFWIGNLSPDAVLDMAVSYIRDEVRALSPKQKKRQAYVPSI